MGCQQSRWLAIEGRPGHVWICVSLDFVLGEHESLRVISKGEARSHLLCKEHSESDNIYRGEEGVDRTCNRGTAMGGSFRMLASVL